MKYLLVILLFSVNVGTSQAIEIKSVIANEYKPETKLSQIFKKTEVYGDLGLLAFDSNVYRSPDKSYLDYFYKSLGPILVQPKVRYGAFFPIKARFSYRETIGNSAELVSKLDYKGTFYQSQNYQNANTYNFDLSSKIVKMLADKQSVSINIFTGKNSENYIDRDTGIEKTSGISSITDKYKYIKYGLYTKYKSRYKNLKSTIKFAAEKRNYVDTVVVSEYDHTNLELIAKSHLKLTKRHKIGLTYNYGTRNYSDRHARRLDGFLSSKNPLLKYVDQSLEFVWRHRFSSHFISYMFAEIGSRSDKYLGYNDFSSKQVKINIIEKNKKHRWKTSISYQTKGYPSAYAFDNPVAGGMTYNVLKMSSKLTYKYSRNYHIIGEIDYHNTNTSDTRYQYKRYLINLGIEYKV